MKTTVYLPTEMEDRLEAASVATGVSRTELIRRGISMLLDSVEGSHGDRALPIFSSARPMAAGTMADEITGHVEARSGHR